MRMIPATLLALALAATPVIAQTATTNPANPTATVIAPAQRGAETTVVTPRHDEDEHTNYGWVGLLGLVGLAGLLGRKRREPDVVDTAPTTYPTNRV